MATATTSQLRLITTPGRFRVAEGLYLIIKPNGNKSWAQRLRVDGKPVDRGLGAFPQVGIREARTLADQNRLHVLSGRGVGRRQPAVAKTPRSKPRLGPPTLDEVARRFHEVQAPRWKGEKSAVAWMLRFNKHISPRFGERPVDGFSVVELRDGLLRPVSESMPETGKRLRIILKQVFEYAVESEWLDVNPIDRIPLKRLTVVKPTHLPALPYEAVPDALRAIDGSTSWQVVRRALRFLVLTAARTHMVRFATWGEIDRESRTWTVPGDKMKQGRPHRTPLSTAAMLVLGDEWETQRSSRGHAPRADALIFPSPKRQPLSDNTLSQLLRRADMGSVHGFRSSFRTWLAERTDASWAVAESALAHNVGNAVEQAYMRSDFLDRRRPLMEAWADHCLPDERAPF